MELETVGDMKDNETIDFEPFGINTFRREICAALGEKFWEELMEGLSLPDIETEGSCGCCNMRQFMARFEKMADKDTVRTVLCRVRHGMRPARAAWAREKLLELLLRLPLPFCSGIHLIGGACFRSAV